LHWYYAEDKIARKRIPLGDLNERLLRIDSGKSNQRLGRIPLVIGMPVVISQNFDVPGGVVNGSQGILKKVRYYVDPDGRRHAISCVVECQDTEENVVPGLPNHHVVALEDTTTIKIEHPYSYKACTLHRTQLPVQPGFVMTAYKSQGKTLDAAVVNLVDCHGTESAYVMVSRVTSLQGLAIVCPFSKEKICCRTSEDLRNETARLEMLALQTVVTHGTEVEAAQAKASIAARFSVDGDDSDDGDGSEDENTVREDSWVRLKRKQRHNLKMIQPSTRRQKRDLDAPRASEMSGVVAVGPSRRSGPEHARVGQITGQRRAYEDVDRGEAVNRASQQHIQRRKRRRLDEPLVRVSICSLFRSCSLMFSLQTASESDSVVYGAAAVAHEHLVANPAPHINATFSFVSSASQQLLSRRKRRRLDEPLVRVSICSSFRSRSLTICSFYRPLLNQSLSHPERQL
jgi:hypothetical protein